MEATQMKRSIRRYKKEDIMKGIRVFIIFSVLLMVFGASEGILTRAASKQSVANPGTASDRIFVESLFRSILDREPDAGGVQHWVNFLRKGESREWVIKQFFNSREYRSRRKSNREFIRDVYQGILGRVPDTAGWNHWLGRMRSGWSRNRVVGYFVVSPEYMKIIGGGMGGIVTEKEKQDLLRKIDRYQKEWYVLQKNRGANRFYDVLDNCNALRYHVRSLRERKYLPAVLKLMSCYNNCYRTHSRQTQANCIKNCVYHFNREMEALRRQ